MRYRRDTLQDRALRIVNRGIMGLGVLVLALSVTQGISGIIGVVLMMFVISGFTGAVMWVARMLEGLFRSRRGLE